MPITGGPEHDLSKHTSGNPRHVHQHARDIVRGREYRFGDEQGYAPQRFKVLEPVREHVAVPRQAPVRVRELELA